MRLPAPIYHSIPGIYLVFGLLTIYFGSEAFWFGRDYLLAGLLFMSGCALIINCFLVLRARRKIQASPPTLDKKPA